MVEILWAESNWSAIFGDPVVLLVLGFFILHVIMLLKAIFRKQWGWFWFMILFPVASLIYLFKH